MIFNFQTLIQSLNLYWLLSAIAIVTCFSIPVIAQTPKYVIEAGVSYYSNLSIFNGQNFTPELNFDNDFTINSREHFNNIGLLFLAHKPICCHDRLSLGLSINIRNPVIYTITSTGKPYRAIIYDVKYNARFLLRSIRHPFSDIQPNPALYLVAGIGMNGKGYSFFVQGIPGHNLPGLIPVNYKFYSFDFGFSVQFEKVNLNFLLSSLGENDFLVERLPFPIIPFLSINYLFNGE